MNDLILFPQAIGQHRLEIRFPFTGNRVVEARTLNHDLEKLDPLPGSSVLIPG